MMDKTNKFPWKEIIIAGITFSAAAFTAWANVKAETAVNSFSIAANEQTNIERYQRLREGQAQIQRLLERLLLERRRDEQL